MPEISLTTPLAVGRMVLPNRLLAAPMATNLAGPDGEVTPALLDHYRRLAGSGVSLVVVESARVSPDAAASPRNLGVFAAAQLDGLSALAAAIRARGARSCLQLWHPGSRSSGGPWSGLTCADFTPQMLSAAREQFAAAATRAVAAGFDAVEVHAAHGYLLHELLCPRSHRGPDGACVPLAVRAACLLETVTQTIAATASAVPVLVRLSAACGHPGGLALSEVIWLVERLKLCGCAAVSLSGGHSSVALLPPNAADTLPGYLLPLSAAVKATTDLPVLLAGRLHERETIQAALADHALDAVMAGRALLADPHWATHVLAGEPVTACRYCNRCYDGLKAGLALQCRNRTLSEEVDRPCLL